MIEYRTAGGSATASEGVLNGLVTPFNVWADIGDVKRGGFKERIAPGTFAKTLQERDIVLINSHDTSQPMARTSIRDGVGSLTLTEDSSAGLRAHAIPVDTSYARDVMACADAGVTRGMSFGFEVIKDSWTDANGNPSDALRGTQRTIQEVRLAEVTTTAFPAYDTTELSARDTINAARGRVPGVRAGEVITAADVRVAKAGYADLETCGECGAADQYGAFCSGCGQPMSEPASAAGKFCSSCGGKVAKRSAHVCGEVRAATVCVDCEKPVSADDKECANCGRELDADDSDGRRSEKRAAVKCPNCGTAIASPSNPGPDGDADSDADDQVIDRSTEPAETTRDEGAALYVRELKARFDEFDAL